MVSRGPVLVTALILLSSSVASAAGSKRRVAPPSEETPASRPIATNAKGFPVPSLKGYEQTKKTIMTDASPAIEGKETKVETFRNEKGDEILKLSTNDVVWAFGVLPSGDPTKGFILRDPACARKLTERWAPDAPFSAPACAVKAKPGK